MISVSNGELTIEPAPLTITVDDKTRGFGEDDPVFTVTFTGFKLGEGAPVVKGIAVESDARRQSRPGDYQVRLADAAASNYLIQPVTGLLKVSTGNLPGDDINIIPQLQPVVPVDNNSRAGLSVISPATFNGLYAISGVDFLYRQTDQQLNPEFNTLYGPRLKQQGDQQDDLLFSNDGNHELWRR